MGFVFAYCILRTVVIYLYLGFWTNPFLSEEEKQHRARVKQIICTATGAGEVDATGEHFTQSRMPDCCIHSCPKWNVSDVHDSCIRISLMTSERHITLLYGARSRCEPLRQASGLSLFTIHGVF